MTERLYYQDSYALDFDASAVRVETRGDRRALWLDRSLFYPTTGGQPHDTGLLGSLRVVNVFEEEDDVVHLVEGSEEVIAGQSLSGRVDWPRRFDHIQQHSGQHVLSASFVRLFDARTVSFHLGANVSTIDLARELPAADIAAAEQAANQVVWDDRSVSIRYAGAEEAAALPLRKESKRVGTLRLVDIDRWDLSACGGTHVARTGTIGMIAVVGWERFKGGQRVEFVCGGRALGRLRQLRDMSAASIKLLSTTPSEIPAAIERLQAEHREQKRVLTSVQTELARFQAGELADSAERCEWGGLVLRVIDADANALKALASAVVTRPGLLCVLVSASTPRLVVAARSADLTQSCAEIIKSLTQTFGGRGGGKPDLAQAGGLTGQSEALLAAVRAWLSR